MLVLTRKLGEVIAIGPTIAITVCHVRSGQVKIGILAPEDVPVWRHELDPLPDQPDNPAAEILSVQTAPLRRKAGER